MWCLKEEKGWSRPLRTKLWCRAWKLMNPEGPQRRCISGLASWKQIALVVFKTHMEKKHLPAQHQHTRYQGMLICSSNKTTSGTWLWSHHLVKFNIIYCHFPRSICLLHRPNRQVKWKCGENPHSGILHVLDGGTNLCNTSSDAIVLWFTPFLRWGSFSGFYLVFSTVIIHTPQVREPMWGLCLLLLWCFIPELEK